jgi:hypothetical protein
LSISNLRGGEAPIPSPSLRPKEGTTTVAPPTESTGPSAFQRVLEGFGKHIEQGEEMANKAIHAGDRELAPHELLSLQAGMYRYTETMTLVAKMAEGVTNGLKTVTSKE